MDAKVSFKKSSYRQRVYQQVDGTIILIFGSDQEPADCKLLADHDVTELVSVVDHVEPAL